MKKKMRMRSSRSPPSLDGFGWTMCVIKTIVCYTALEVTIWKIICNCLWNRKLEMILRVILLTVPNGNSVRTDEG